MKTINVTFTDKEFKRISKKKGKLPWHRFILMKGGVENGNNN